MTQTCKTFSSSSRFFRSSSSCFRFTSISAFLKCYGGERLWHLMTWHLLTFSPLQITPLCPSPRSTTHILLSCSSCVRRCSSSSLLFFSFSISSSMCFSLSLSSSSCFFFCMDESSCSERFTSAWYSVSISFRVITVAWRSEEGSNIKT